LIYLFVAETWRRSRRPLSAIWLERPWRSEFFKSVTRDYWAGFGSAPSDDLLDAVAWAAWAAHIAGNLSRLPELAANRKWVDGNVESVLDGEASFRS
jgi:hypothetical protein